MSAPCRFTPGCTRGDETHWCDGQAATMAIPGIGPKYRERGVRIAELEKQLAAKDVEIGVVRRSCQLEAARANDAERVLSEVRNAKDGAYAERNQCVALIVRMALALGWRAGVRDHEDKPGENWEPDWRSLVCIDLPTGQVSWHFHDSEKHLLAGLPVYPASWDGHDTPEKYRRVCAAISPPKGTEER